MSPSYQNYNYRKLRDHYGKASMGFGMDMISILTEMCTHFINMVCKSYGNKNLKFSIFAHKEEGSIPQV